MALLTSHQWALHNGHCLLHLERCIIRSQSDPGDYAVFETYENLHPLTAAGVNSAPALGRAFRFGSGSGLVETS